MAWPRKLWAFPLSPDSFSSLKAGHAKNEANGMLPEINKGERGYSQSGKKVPSVSWCGVDLSCADALMTTEFVHELVCGCD